MVPIDTEQERMVNTFQIVEGDNLATLRRLPDACIDSVVTDAPYGLGKEPDPAALLRSWLADDLRAHATEELGAVHMKGTDADEVADYLYPNEEHDHGAGGGFMGKKWDAFVPSPAIWRECLRVLKPGGYLLSFFGPRTYHWGTTSIALAGFEVRDLMTWLNGQGMPKSQDVGRQIDLKRCTLPGKHCDKTLTEGGHLCPPHPDGEPYRGHRTALRPCHEPIAMCRKPLAGALATNVLGDGTGGLDIDATQSHGRWPPNVAIDRGVADDLGDLAPYFYCPKVSPQEREAGLDGFERQTAGELTGGRAEGSTGLANPRAGAGRTTKAGRANTHPTVKPLALMRWLVRLVTPPGGYVLDPFAGSGSTGIAAVLEGKKFLGCELDPEYCAIARARIAHAVTNDSEDKA